MAKVKFKLVREYQRTKEQSNVGKRPATTLEIQEVAKESESDLWIWFDKNNKRQLTHESMSRETVYIPNDIKDKLDNLAKHAEEIGSLRKGTAVIALLEFALGKLEQDNAKLKVTIS